MSATLSILEPIASEFGISLADTIIIAGNSAVEEAAKAAAIGTAAGLTAGQLTDLARAAKNTSLALGRDLTDSFNRLIRGVTKAEPELLDELGIILEDKDGKTAWKQKN